MIRTCGFITEKLVMCTRLGTIDGMCWQHARMRTCSICLERIYDETGTNSSTLSCTHSSNFHGECLELCKYRECPLCRAPFVTDVHSDEISDDVFHDDDILYDDDVEEYSFIIRIPASIVLDMLSDDS